MMRGRFVLLGMLCATVGCGDSSSGDEDAAPSIDAAVDLDAPIGGALLTISVAGADVTAWDFGNVALGGSAVVALTVTNDGTAAVGAPRSVLESGDASEFFLDEAMSTCATVAELAPGASCSVVVMFSPVSTGAKATTLGIAADLGGSTDVSLSGAGIGGTVILEFEPAVVDFGLVEVGDVDTLAVTITNPGATDVGIAGTNVSGGGFAGVSTDCGASLGIGESCEVTIQFGPTGVGLVSGQLRVVTSGGDATLALGGRGAGRITVLKAGTGSGTVTSSTPGISCGATCTGLFSAPVTLITTADALSSFETWDTACGTSPTCVIAPSATPTTVTATFGPDTGIRTLTLHVTGTEFAMIGYLDPQTLVSEACLDVCTVQVDMDDDIFLHAMSPGAFIGYSGGCTGTDPFCRLTMDADYLVTADFAPDDGNVATFTLPFDVHRVTFDPSDNLITANTTEVRRLDSSGGTVWLETLPPPTFDAPFVAGMETDADDNAYIFIAAQDGATVAGGLLHKVSAAGVLEWSESMTADAFVYNTRLGDGLAVSSTGHVGVVLNPDELRVYDADQSLVFSRTIPAPLFADSIDVDASGTWYVGGRSPDDESVHVMTFDSAGTSLGELDRLPGFYRGVIDIDGTDEIVGVTSGRSDVDITRTGPTGFEITEDLSFAAWIPAAVAVDGDGNVAFVRLHSDTVAGGLVLRSYAPDGDILYELVRPTEQSVSFLRAGMVVRDLATDSTGRTAVAGDYTWDGGELGWIGMYDPP